MINSYYSPPLAIWEVTLDDDKIEFNSPKMIVAARNAIVAARLAKEILDKDWNDNRMNVLSVKYIDALCGVIEDET